MDAADPRIDDKIAAVESLLDQLGLRDIPILRVLNKIDLLPDGHADELARRYEAVAVSAVDRSGLEALMKAAEERLGRRSFDPPYAAPRVSG